MSPNEVEDSHHFRLQPRHNFAFVLELLGRRGELLLWTGRLSLLLLVWSWGQGALLLLHKRSSLGFSVCCCWLGAVPTNTAHVG